VRENYFGVSLATVPSSKFVQQTLVAPTAMLSGLFWSEARMVGVPPPAGTFITVPSV